MLEFSGVHQEILLDETREICAEGARNSGKTTVALWKVRQSLKDHPGIWWFIFRYSDGDTQSKLRPAFEKICEQFDQDDQPSWDSREKCYLFSNGSKCYAFGLKAVDAMSRYAKLRGLGVSGVYNDQSEELPADIGSEIRAALRQPGFPHQLMFTPNPPSDTHWLTKADKGGFPVTNSIPGRKYYKLTLYQNAHHLPDETIKNLEATYPPSHARYSSMIMGERGLNVIGTPVYEGVFNRLLHVRQLSVDPTVPLVEAFAIGKANPAWVIAQQPYSGGWSLLGGILGENLFLEDFLPLVQQTRTKWFPKLTNVQTCCAPSGAVSRVSRYTAISELRKAGYAPRAREDSNAPDVRLAMIERIAGYMRKRGSSGEEAFGIQTNLDANNPYWLRASRDGVYAFPFMANACEAGYVWDEHTISVGSKEVRRTLKDDWFEHGMNCLELLECNFGANRLSREEHDQKKQSMRVRRELAVHGTGMDWAS